LPEKPANHPAAKTVSIGKLNDPNNLTWTVHLAKQDPKKTGILIACAILAGTLGALFMSNVWMFPLGAIIILLGTADYLLPVTYRIGEDGASSRCGISTTAIAWDRVKRVVVGEDGVKLSPLQEKSRASAFRGVFLREAGNLDEIRDCVEYWRNLYATNVGTGTDGRDQEEHRPPSGERSQEARS
jgi:hypothetical protein